MYVSGILYLIVTCMITSWMQPRHLLPLVITVEDELVCSYVTLVLWYTVYVHCIL
jgi:hypothetical protein